MSYKNTILDFYDDKGRLLKSLIPSKEELPEVVKTASTVGSDDLSDYALVIVDGEDQTKKFNISDAGNTWLSSLYYTANKNSLPAEAQKIASTMIKAASEAYDIPLTETIVEDAIELSDLDTNIVDLTGVSPSIIRTPTKEDYALNGRYPINSPSQINTAQQYFSDNLSRFEPKDRRDYAVKVASVSRDFGVELNEDIINYSGDNYSKNLDEHLAVRYYILSEEEAPAEVKESLMKLASSVEDIPPEEFATTLAEFDRITGLSSFWDTDLADPWFSTYGKEKVAMGMPLPKASFTVGEMRVTEEELKLLSQDTQKMTNLFGEDFASSFAKSPVQIFESMPLPQKKTIARMATDTLGRV